MEKYKNTYRRESTRLKNWDYGLPGFYFVAICTQNHECYFGDIVKMSGTQNAASLRSTPMGDIAQRYWLEIPNHFSFVTLDEFIVMPNHIHDILQFKKTDYQGENKNSFQPQSQNPASVIRGFKAGVKKYATLNNIEFFWQSRFHDHVIKSQSSLIIIRKYIKDNPLKWANEKTHEDAYQGGITL